MRKTELLKQEEDLKIELDKLETALLEVRMKVTSTFLGSSIVPECIF